MSEAWTNDLALKREAFDALGTLAEQGLVTRVSLQMYDTRGPFPYEVFSSIAGATGEIHRAMQWWVGDLLNQAEIAHGDDYAQIAAETGMSERTLINRKSVAKRVAPERRVPGVAFAIHDAVAALSPAQQKKWLKKAAEGLWTREIMREQLRASQGIEVVQISKGELREMCHALLEHAEPVRRGGVPRPE